MRVRAGMNLFLKNLDITFRRDPTNYRPRINKHDSTKDREQKLAGTFYVRAHPSLVPHADVVLACTELAACTQAASL